MKLTEYLEAVVKAKVEEPPKKFLSPEKAKVKLSAILPPGVVISDSLGISLSDKRLEELKKGVKSITPIGIGKDIDEAIIKKHKLPKISAEIKKSSSEILLIKFEDDERVLIKRTGKGDIGEKELTPSALNIAVEGEKYTIARLKASIKSAISSKSHISDNLKKVILDLVDLASKKTTDTFPKPGESRKVLLEVKDFKKVMEPFDEDDQNKIWKDLGELISAIIACEGNQKAQIYFPTSVNEPLVDFFVEKTIGKKTVVQSFSAKAIKKASDGTGKPSLTGLKKFIERNKKILDNNEKEDHLYDIIKLLDDKSVQDMSQNYINLAFRLEEFGHKGIIDNAESDLKAKVSASKELKKFANQKFFKEKKEVNVIPNIDPEDQKTRKRWFAYACFKFCKQVLNKNYADVLSQIINAKVSIDQAYLIAPRENGLVFYFKNFKDMSFVFDAGVSYNEISANMGFTAKISEKELK